MFPISKREALPCISCRVEHIRLVFPHGGSQRLHPALRRICTICSGVRHAPARSRNLHAIRCRLRASERFPFLPCILLRRALRRILKNRNRRKRPYAMQTINLNLHLENLLPDHFEYSFYSYYSTRRAEGKLKTPKSQILYESAAKMKSPGFAHLHFSPLVEKSSATGKERGCTKMSGWIYQRFHKFDFWERYISERQIFSYLQPHITNCPTGSSRQTEKIFSCPFPFTFRSYPFYRSEPRAPAGRRRRRRRRSPVAPLFRQSCCRRAQAGFHCRRSKRKWQ